MDADRVLVFGAHSDDEIIGVGGTLAKLSNQGTETTVVTFTKGETGYANEEHKSNIVNMRKAEASKTDEILEITNRINLGKPTQGVKNDRETFQDCVEIIREIRPDVIFSHSSHDKHRDHKAISHLVDEARWQAGENVLADRGEQWYTPKLYYYEILDPFTFPNMVVDISNSITKKKEAMKAQASQLEVLPRIMQYIDGLGKIRGYLADSEYGEAFRLSSEVPKIN